VLSLYTVQNILSQTTLFKYQNHFRKIGRRQNFYKKKAAPKQVLAGLFFVKQKKVIEWQ
jgi:hypothetical protein